MAVVAWCAARAGAGRAGTCVRAVLLLVVLDDQFVPVEDAYLRSRLMDLHWAVDQRLWDGVAVGVQRDVAFDATTTLMHFVDLRHMKWQRYKGRLLGGEELSRRVRQVALWLAAHCLAPGAKLLVEVVQALERAAHVEVVLDVMEGSLDAPGAILVPRLVRHESEAEASRKRLHLGRGHSFSTETVGDDDRQVVDHAAVRCTAEMDNGFAEKHAALKARPTSVDLGVQVARVTHHQRRTLQRDLLARDLDRVRRRVVLHLLARTKAVRAKGLLGRRADLMPSAE